MDAGETETNQQKHTRLAWQLLNQADHELTAGDLLQSSEKLWGATSHALKALCESRGWRHSKYGHRQEAVKRLAVERNDESISLSFKIAEACHANFYNDWLSAAELEENRHAIHGFIVSVLGGQDHDDR